MNRTHVLIAALTVACLASAGVPLAGQHLRAGEELSDTPDRARTIVVEVENDARIPPADLTQMEQLVGRSYLAIGVRVLWMHGEVPVQDPRGFRVHLRLLSRTRADRKIATERIRSDVLGQANRPARVADIFCHRVVEASMKYWQEYTHVLGLVVAHELAHVLLPAHSHSETGIMNGRANLWVKTVHDFKPEEGAAIRSLLIEGAQPNR